jgi:hypothetical protein
MLSKLKETKKGLISLGLGLFSLLLTAPVYALDAQAEAPPNADQVLRVVRWCIWGGDIILFAIFIHGVIQAANKKRHGEADVSFAIWPIVGVGVVTIGNGIWSAIAGI